MSLAEQLSALRARSAELTGSISGLSSEEWQAETNCPPWRVRDLATHLVTSGRGFVRSIERGLSGVMEPAPPQSAADLTEADPGTVARALSQVTDDFERLYDGLSESQLQMICWHRRGNRSVRWYAAHRLAEVTFHGWDLETSLGRAPEFPEATAKLLLPMLLESNVPRTYAAGLSTQRGSGERYLLQVSDDQSLSWSVTIGPEVLEVRRGDGSADVRIKAPAADLALLVYGRKDISSLEHVEGNRTAIERFREIFPRP
jgi:uncharacterized protein (TIGR03083 family)